MLKENIKLEQECIILEAGTMEEDEIQQICSKVAVLKP